MTSPFDAPWALSYTVPIGDETPKSLSFRDIVKVADRQTDWLTEWLRHAYRAAVEGLELLLLVVIRLKLWKSYNTRRWRQLIWCIGVLNVLVVVVQYWRRHHYLRTVTAAAVRRCCCWCFSGPTRQCRSRILMHCCVCHKHILRLIFLISSENIANVILLLSLL